MGENEPTPTQEPVPTPAAQEGNGDGQGASAPPPGEAPPEPPAPAPDPLQVALETTKKDLEQAQARLRAVSKAYTDLQAEMKAFKERMEARAKLDSELQAFEQVRRFFDPVMNLKRSIASPGEDLGALVEGLRIVHHQFMEALAKLGLEEVPGEGSSFDPNLHEAIAVTPVDDAAKDGKVLVVHTTGYAVKGRVLQAAQVVIGKFQEPAGDA